MNRRASEAVPAALPIDDALRSSASLARLRERLDDSRRRFAAIHDLLPAALATQVEAGPLDDAGWTLLAASPSAAAKLRQLLPALQQRLQASGWSAAMPPRVRVRAT